MITYSPQHLLISLSAASPEALHHALMNGIVNNLQNQMQSPMPISPAAKEGNFYLLQLLETLLPTEKQLEKLHVDSEK